MMKCLAILTIALGVFSNASACNPIRRLGNQRQEEGHGVGGGNHLVGSFGIWTFNALTCSLFLTKQHVALCLSYFTVWRSTEQATAGGTTQDKLCWHKQGAGLIVGRPRGEIPAKDDEPKDEASPKEEIQKEEDFAADSFTTTKRVQVAKQSPKCSAQFASKCFCKPKSPAQHQTVLQKGHDENNSENEQPNEKRQKEADTIHNAQ